MFTNSIAQVVKIQLNFFYLKLVFNIPKTDSFNFKNIKLFPGKTTLLIATVHAELHLDCPSAAVELKFVADL